MTIAGQARALLAKDILLAGRSADAITRAGALGVLTTVAIALAIGPDTTGTGHPPALSTLWGAYLFASILCFDATMQQEFELGAMEAVRLSGLNPAAIFLGKLLTNLLVVAIVCGTITAVGAVLFGTGLGWTQAAVLGLGLVGVAAIGTLCSAQVGIAGARVDLLALLVLPLALPLVLASGRVLSGMAASGGVDGRTLGLLAAFDVVYLVAGWLAFETTLAE